MKICIITLAEKGGMIHYSSQLSEALSKTNNVYLIVPEETNYDFNKNIHIKHISLPIRYLSLQVFKFNILIKAINEINPDVIHITAMHPWLIFALPFLKKYPIISTIHDVRIHKGEWNPIWALSLWSLIRYSDKLFVHGSWAMKQLIIDGIPKNKIIEIKHGEYSFLTKYGQNEFKKGDSILFFGRINDYKGLDYLIKAVPIITKEIPDVKIIIAGEGKIEKYSKQIENNQNFEIYNKYISDDEIAFFFQRAKIVVLPYIECTQSGVIPIAYSFKKPVIATNVGCLPEVIEDGKTGYIVPPRDVLALANAIINLLKDEKSIIQMGENAYKKLMTEEMSWDKIADRTIEVYKETINEI